MFINLTPHSIVFFGKNTTLTFEPSGDVLRLNEDYSFEYQIKDVENIPVFQQQLSFYEDLPKEIVDTYYIVSALVLSYIKKHHPERKDFLAPGTGLFAKRRDGNIIGVTAFVR
jgi:hypothetical protein